MRSPSRLLRPLRPLRLLAITCAVTAGAALGAVPAHAAPVYPVALPDAFYSQPPNLADARPGDVLDSRVMPAPPLFLDTDAVQLKFRTTNSEGKPLAAVTTVLSPRGAAPNRPVLSFQHVVNALGLHCAPSQALYTSDPDIVIREAPALHIALQRGWSVALPDHLGPNSSYGAARLGGQITLDGIRAVRNFEPLQAGESPVAAAGYSGGAMATSWAAALAPVYAPDIQLAGSAYGGTPMDLTWMAESLGYDSHPVFGLAMAAALGLEREYPDRMPITEQLNDRGLAVRDQIANGCTNEIIRGGAGLSAGQVAKSLSLADDPETRRVLDENSLVHYTDSVPNAPVYEWHAQTDFLISVPAIEETNRRYCAAGVSVTSAAVPSPDHMSAAVIGLPGALDFLDARFAGKPAPRC
ncbi:lipase [Rhodococcus triatomae]|uniref:Secretory lipase n=1 Tax=Rhodococcus triatomae TaxID=300028 RepID=A0A1G8HQI0_9NOCA|nr:lipase family protein [Rhodococcus triatomae]QNG20853.1 lipase [Rhodococcus triatomae]QNG23232.1 lipase [Rhodococcus triatomae]SDI08915.1 Secretory lipase [Rhodococcus triatomae]